MIREKRVFGVCYREKSTSMWKRMACIAQNMGIIAIVAIVCITTGCSAFSSSSSLKEQLLGCTWEQIPSHYETSIVFHQDGKMEYIHNGKTYRTESWSILDDKTLVIDGDYYDWETEWMVSEDELRFGNWQLSKL